MTLDVLDRDGVCLIVVKGEVKLGQPTLMLRKKSEELVAAGTKHFVLDMLAVPWLDSSGIGEVYACYKRARQIDGIVKLVLRDRSYSLFTLTQLDKVFEIFHDVDQALESFATPES